ncbi:MAG: SDR family oxidoreductase [Ruminococcaceae bacterium]|nr:SDR family oxidoreductase [Oscillospiraceae bacterium]
MKALITGASAGIGREMARVLAEKGIDLILVARRKERLEELAGELCVQTEIICADLSCQAACYDLCTRAKDVDILINNAGFGLFGEFEQTDLSRELEMIDLNVRTLHILTKHFYKEFVRRDNGYILNVASSAAFMPGPLLACYYATKAYVLRLSQSLWGEIKARKSKVYVGALCPGPVDTEFNQTANVRFAIKGLRADDVARYAVKKMFARKPVIVPGIGMKAGKFALRLIPDTMAARIGYHIQKRKGE